MAAKRRCKIEESRFTVQTQGADDGKPVVTKRGTWNRSLSPPVHHSPSTPGFNVPELTGRLKMASY